MREPWVEFAVEQVALKVGIGPFGSNIKVETFVADGVPVISGSHLHESVLTGSSFNYITEEHADRLRSANVYRGDVIFTHAGTVGQVSYIPNDSRFERYVLSQRQFFVRCDERRILPEFLTLYFKSERGRAALMSNINRTGVPSLSRPVTYIKSVVVPVPPLTEQHRIIDFVGSVADLGREVRSAAAFARDLLAARRNVIFREADALSRAVREVGEVEMGQSPPGSACNRLGVGIPLLNGPTEFGDDHPTEAQWTKEPRKFSLRGDILICVRGATAGRMNVADRRYAIGRGLAAVRGTSELDTAFLRHALIAYQRELLQSAGGTIFPNISRDGLMELRVSWPSPTERARAVAELADLEGYVNALRSQAMATDVARDVLIADLLSGAHEIPESYDQLLQPA